MITTPRLNRRGVVILDPAARAAQNRLAAATALETQASAFAAALERYTKALPADAAPDTPDSQARLAAQQFATIFGPPNDPDRRNTAKQINASFDTLRDLLSTLADTKPSQAARPRQISRLGVLLCS